MTLVPTELDPSPPLVVVIDDDAGVCSAVSRVLGTGGYRVETFQRPDECLDEVGELDPACILADIRMPELDGIALSSAMRARGVRVPIVFMTGTGDVETVVRAMKQDSADLLAKPFSADALLGAVSRATDLARRSDDGLRSLVSLWALAGRLTPREAEVCALVACGSPNKVVAARIGTTEKTVKVHRGRVMSKLAAPSLAELVRMVDRLIAGETTRVIRLDGVERVRPNSVNIVIDVVKRARGHSAANQDDSPARVP